MRNITSSNPQFNKLFKFFLSSVLAQLCYNLCCKSHVLSILQQICITTVWGHRSINSYSSLLNSTLKQHIYKMNILKKIQSVITRLGNRNYGKVGIIGVPFDKGQVL